MNLDSIVPLIPQMYADPVPYVSHDLPFDLFKSLYVSSNGPNFIFSPYSVICALMMLLVGSSGHTQLQLARALFGPGFNDTAKLLNRHVTQFDRLNQHFIFETKFLVQIGNFIYSQQEFKPNYTQTIAKLLKANSTLVDFDMANQNSTIERINLDMSRVTIGAVLNFLSKLEDNANLLLLNTIHFHAKWYIKFNQNLTQLGQFRISPNKVVQASMMMQESECNGYQYYRDSGLEAIKMPYDGSGQVSMVIILPPENVTVRSYIRDNQFNAQAFDTIYDNFEKRNFSPLIIPRFKLSLKHSLKSTLHQLGITDAFESDVADFSRMTQRGLPVVSEIMQNAAIECNETGNWASWEYYGFDAVDTPPETQFIANRPFLFVVVSIITSGQSESHPNSITQPKKSVKQFLFAGVVEDPTD